MSSDLWMSWSGPGYWSWRATQRCNDPTLCLPSYVCSTGTPAVSGKQLFTSHCHRAYLGYLNRELIWDVTGLHKQGRLSDSNKYPGLPGSLHLHTHMHVRARTRTSYFKRVSWVLKEGDKFGETIHHSTVPQQWEEKYSRNPPFQHTHARERTHTHIHTRTSTHIMTIQVRFKKLVLFIKYLVHISPSENNKTDKMLI